MIHWLLELPRDNIPLAESSEKAGKRMSSEAAGRCESLPRLSRDRCPACGNDDTRPLMRLFDDRYGMPDEFDVVECRTCTAIYLAEFIPGEHLGELYETYYGARSEPRLRSPGLATSLRARLRASRLWRAVTGGIDLAGHVRRGDRVLDVGCGYGPNARAVQMRGAHWKGLDIDPKVCGFLERHDLPVFQGSLEEFAESTSERFDVILMSQILEHTIEPIAFLRSAARCLAQGGHILLSCPNSDSRYRVRFGRAWLHWHVPYHVVQWNPRSLSEAASRADLSVEWLVCRTPPSWYYCQRHFRQAERGKRNVTYKVRFRPSAWILIWPWLRLADMLRCGSGDAVVASLRPRAPGAAAGVAVLPGQG